MKKRSIVAVSICVFLFYVGSYGLLYAKRSPAANLMYFVYLRIGARDGSFESVLYYVCYPIYKLHRAIGGAKHNFDRPKPVDAE